MSNTTGHAVEVIRYRMPLTDDAFISAVVWRVPQPVPPSRHRYKYRLAYVVAGVCVVRYDNERGKGDHRHWNQQQRSYCFVNPDQLLLDFEADVRRWNNENRGD